MRPVLFLVLLCASLPAAELTLAVQRYEAGVGNFVELNDARSGVVTLQTQEVRAHYDLLLARASLLRELGLPLVELVAPK